MGRMEHRKESTINCIRAVQYQHTKNRRRIAEKQCNWRYDIVGKLQDLQQTIKYKKWKDNPERIVNWGWLEITNR